MGKDFKEFFHIGRELSPFDLERLNYHQNLWPAEPFDFKESMLTLFTTLDRCKDMIGTAIAEVLEQDENFINEMTAEGDCVMRLLYYPAKGEKKDRWCNEHTDINFFTILPRCTAKGLHLLNKNNEWIDVVVPDGAFIVNCGDQLENLTNGYFRSARHRVIDPGLGRGALRCCLLHPPSRGRPIGPPPLSH